MLLLLQMDLQPFCFIVLLVNTFVSDFHLNLEYFASQCIVPDELFLHLE